MPPIIVTYTGRLLRLDDPDPASVALTDIAAALARLPRFTGHTRTRWTVAQHCLLCHHLAGVYEQPVSLYALLHDAAEAYIGDMSTPLKALLPEIRAIEGRIQRAILAHFHLQVPRQHVVNAIHTLDLVALAAERRCLMPPTLPLSPDAERLIQTPFCARLIETGVAFVKRNRFGTAGCRSEGALAKRFADAVMAELKARNS